MELEEIIIIKMIIELEEEIIRIKVKIEEGEEIIETMENIKVIEIIGIIMKKMVIKIDNIMQRKRALNIN